MNSNELIVSDRIDQLMSENELCIDLYESSFEKFSKAKANKRLDQMKNNKPDTLLDVQLPSILEANNLNGEEFTQGSLRKRVEYAIRIVDASSNPSPQHLKFLAIMLAAYDRDNEMAKEIAGIRGESHEYDTRQLVSELESVVEITKPESKSSVAKSFESQFAKMMKEAESVKAIR